MAAIELPNDVTVWAKAVEGGQPIIRRDANTTILTLTRDEALRVIAVLAGVFEYTGPQGAHLVIEGARVFPREVFE